MHAAVPATSLSEEKNKLFASAAAHAYLAVAHGPCPRSPFRQKLRGRTIYFACASQSGPWESQARFVRMAVACVFCFRTISHPNAPQRITFSPHLSLCCGKAKEESRKKTHHANDRYDVELALTYGAIQQNDVLLLITFSGKTPELLQLLPHLPAELPLIAMTSHTSYHTSPLTRGRENAILLPAPIHESEITSFGLSAPTTSTTVAMALGDALALSAANQIHNIPGLGPKEVFKKNHPGGAIGQVNLAESQPDAGRIRELAVRWDEMLPVEPSNQSTGLPTPAMSETSSESDLDLVEWNCPPQAADIATEDGDSIKGLTVLDCLRLAVKSPKGWLLARTGGVIPPKRLQSCENVMANALAPEFGIVVDLHEQLCVPAEMDIEEVARMLSLRKALNEVTDDTVIALIDSGKIVGAVEVGTVLEHIAY